MDNGRTVSENAELSKASQGTQQYEEWLRKYRLKRSKKQEYEESNQQFHNGSDDNFRLADYACKAFEKAFELAGPAAGSLFDVLSRVERTDASGHGRIGSSAQIKALLSECKDLDYDLTSLEDNYERLAEFEGAESRLFVEDGEDFIIKVTDFTVQSESPFDFLFDRVILHNAIFPETSYQVVGYTFDEDFNFRFILTQPKIKGRAATLEEIQSFVSKLGFDADPLHPDWYENDLIKIQDLHPKNVLIDTRGDLYVIDDVIQRKNN